MKEFVLLMYDDASGTAIASDGNRWGEYISRLRSSGLFDGGSTIGPGLRVRKGHPDAAAPLSWKVSFVCARKASRRPASFWRETPPMKAGALSTSVNCPLTGRKVGAAPGLTNGRRRRPVRRTVH